MSEGETLKDWRLGDDITPEGKELNVDVVYHV